MIKTTLLLAVGIAAGFLIATLTMKRDAEYTTSDAVWTAPAQQEDERISF
jgi:hypothetical protein